MKTIMTTGLATAIILTLAAGDGTARSRHKANRAAAPQVQFGPDDPYDPHALPGAAIRAQARANQNAPGLTNELAPGNIATATGGPSGGVPGFSGR